SLPSVERCSPCPARRTVEAITSCGRLPLYALSPRNLSLLRYEVGSMSSKPRSTVTRLDAYRRRAQIVPMDRTLDEVLGRAPIGFLYLDHALRCVKINPWLGAAYGVGTDDALGRPFRSLVPGVAAVVEEDLTRLLDGGSPVRIILPVEHAGERTYYQHHFAPIR